MLFQCNCYSKSNFLQRIAAAPSFSGLGCFPEGHGFKQWTGDDSKALMKVVHALEI